MILNKLWFGIPHSRYCTQCRTTKPRKGGRDVVYSGGMKLRWVCAQCAEAIDARGVA